MAEDEEEEVIREKVRGLCGPVEIRSYPKGHHGLLCCAASCSAQRIYIYASRFGFLRALHLSIFEQPQSKVGIKYYVPLETGGSLKI
jgi:hypothetical protein